MTPLRRRMIEDMTRISAGRKLINFLDDSALGFQRKATSPAPNR
jgi:hypothetical protein